MKSIEACVSERMAFPEGELEAIGNYFVPREVTKRSLLLEAGSASRELIFIESGYVRMYHLVEGNEVTSWIGGPGSFITALSSFVLDAPNLWFIQAVTACNLRVASKTDHLFLLDHYHRWLAFDNLLLANAFSALEQNMLAQLHQTAKERYETLLAVQPALFQHVPLQYIASMLGIKPETLSRLRKAAVGAGAESGN